MKIAILGYGREGASLKKLLMHSRLFRKDKIAILDKRLDRYYLRNLDKFNLIFRSPGIPYTLREVQKSKKKGVLISSPTKVFFSLVDPKRIIGVTGTKGKGTTCTLIYQILKNAGKKAVLAGNIGKPMLDIIPQAQKADYVILELSSFQLQDLTVSPHIAVVLDVFPDHLDAHKNLKEYYDAKANIGRFQKKNDIIFYFANNPASKRIAQKSQGIKIPITPKENNIRKNYEMARAAARYLGVSKKIIEKTIFGFKGLEHRLELTRSIRIYSNVLKNIRIDFVNDSAATNPVATAAAIRSFASSDTRHGKWDMENGNLESAINHYPLPISLILIAGGRSKIHDFSAMTAAIKDSKNLQMVILFGENQREIRDAIRKEFNKSKKIIAAPYIVSKPDLKSSVTLAYQFAKSLVIGHQLASPSRERSGSSIIVLFSPTSASFDQFKNYADRGEKFKNIVKKLR